MLRLTLAALVALPLAAQETPDPSQTALMLELAQPGPEHRRLAMMEGQWDVTYASPMPGMSFSTVAENELILGGRFLVSRLEGDVNGQRFATLHIMGFDRGPGVYTAVGFDTFGTFYVTGAGPWDPSINGADLAGSYDDPVTGHAHTYEFQWRVHSEDHYTWTIVFIEDGERMTVMEGVYRRRPVQG